MTNNLNMFIPITKINAERREVWGWGAIEEPDNSDEILDYMSSKPLFMDWSNKAQKRSGGKSFGNVRSMHQNVAAGKLIALKADDVNKGFYVGAKIVDDNEWKKVEQGVYTGFSIGGSYAKRWSDFQNPGKIRYTAKPAELSIVDSPCIPSATFQMVKADGVTVTRSFSPTEGKNIISVVRDNMIKVVGGGALAKAGWEENKHPRDDDGKFESGGGGGGSGSKKEPRERTNRSIGLYPREQKAIAERKAKMKEYNADDYFAHQAKQKQASPKGEDINRRETKREGTELPGIRTKIPDDKELHAGKPGSGASEAVSQTRRDEAPPELSFKERVARMQSHGEDFPSSQKEAREQDRRAADANPYGDNPKMRQRADAGTADKVRDLMASQKKAPAGEWWKRQPGQSDADFKAQMDTGYNEGKKQFDVDEAAKEKRYAEQRADSAEKYKQYKAGQAKEEKEFNARFEREYGKNKVTKGDVMTKLNRLFDLLEKAEEELVAEDELPSLRGDSPEEETAEFSEEEMPAEEADKADELPAPDDDGTLDEDEMPAEDLPVDEEDAYEDTPEQEVVKVIRKTIIDLADILETSERRLVKQDIPGAPESIADIPLAGKIGPAYNVEQMPPPNVLLEIKPNAEPSQDILANHAVMSKDLTAAFNAWLPKVGVLVKSMVAAAVAEALDDLGKTANSAPVQISSAKNARIIKVRKEQ